MATERMARLRPSMCTARNKHTNLFFPNTFRVLLGETALHKHAHACDIDDHLHVMGVLRLSAHTCHFHLNFSGTQMKQSPNPCRHSDSTHMFVAGLKDTDLTSTNWCLVAGPTAFRINATVTVTEQVQRLLSNLITTACSPRLARAHTYK